MSGMDRNTGAALHGDAHLRQSVATILSTPIGTRVGRRDFGSLLPALTDQPMTSSITLRPYADTAVALSRWEAPLRLRRVTLSPRPNRRSAPIPTVADRP